MPTRAPVTAPIVELSAFRRRNIERVRPRPVTAELISLRRSLGNEASVEIDGLDRLAERYDDAVLTHLARRVRALLDKEFGPLRVHRSRRRFVARHRSAEALVAGLLRVQYHARAIALPSVDRHGERVAPAEVSVTWGVGRSAPEAELERLRRRRRRKRQS